LRLRVAAALASRDDRLNTFITTLPLRW